MFPRSMSARSEILESHFVMRHRETKTNVKADFRLIKNNHPYEINYNFWKIAREVFYESEAVTGTGYDVIKGGVAESLNASLINNLRKKQPVSHRKLQSCSEMKKLFLFNNTYKSENEMNYISTNCFARLNSREVCYCIVLNNF